MVSPKFNNTLSYFTSEPNKITDSIYIGAFNHSKNKKMLLELGITHIVCAGKGLKCYYPDTFAYIKFEVEDGDEADISVHFSDAFEFIDQAVAEGGKILIHCAAGVSRSATIAISYFMQKKCLAYKEAYLLVKDARQQISPNSGFIKQLKELEFKLQINENKDDQT